MKKRLWPALALMLCGLLLLTPLLQAATTPAKPAPAPAKPTPGIEIAQTISMITGVAISPLLGVGGVGAWKYFHATKEERPGLPWFAKPLFWLPALFLVALCFAKDVMGPAVPTALKKPLDVAETFENKVSGLVATGAFVPMIASVFHAVSDAQSASLASQGFAAISFAPLLNILLVPFAMIAFFVVWITSHAINVLILISPFATVDAVLKGIRAALLASVAGTSFVNPMVGALWALVIILVSYLLAGWAFRLAVFGTVFSWDFATLRRKRFQPDPQRNWLFLARAVEKVPVRTYGQLEKNSEGKLIFRYRPWLVRPVQELTLPAGNLAVGRGFIYPELIETQGDKTKTLFLLPPRYRSHEEAFAQIYRLPVQDVGLLKGLKSIWNFIREITGFGAPKQALPAA